MVRDGGGALEQRLTRRVLTDPRAPVVLGLAGLTLAAWGYTATLAARMTPGMTTMEMPGMPGMLMPAPWGAAEYAGLVVMWAVMMVAMMTPAVAPAVLLFARLAGERRRQGRATAPTAAFLGGYLVTWAAFSLGAALAQYAFHGTLLLDASGEQASRAVAGALLVAAGLYQWTPLKHRCLAQCQSPLGFFSAHWREGVAGALGMGARHGATCVACCWLLMLLLFVAGVMNLLWVALLAGLVLLERLGRGPGAARITGVVLAGAGMWLLLAR